MRRSASAIRFAATSASHAARSAWIASAGRHARRSRELVGHRQRLVECAPSDGELDAEHLERPLVPPHRLRAVGAVRFARVTEVFAGALVRPAHQMNLRERVEHGAGRLVELDRAADFERAREDLLRALQIAKLHEDLAERRERDGEAVSRAERLVERHAALGERQRLFVLMAHQRDVRLVVHDAREHVVGLDRRRQAFTLAKRRGGFFAAARLARGGRRTANARARGGAGRRRRAARTRLR